MRATRLAAVAALLVLAGALRADGCCMVPRDFGGDVDQNWQRGLVTFHGGHEELFLRIQPSFHGQEGPAFLEWVVTVPSKPTGFAVAEGDPVKDAVALHDRLQALAAAQFAARTRFEIPEFKMGKGAMVASGVALSSPALGGIDLDAPVTVGPFEITGVRAKGPEGLAELNAYLEGRGYAGEDPAHMKWFTDRGFTFLCIHITPPAGKTSVGRTLDLPALRIGFDVDRPYYPAKFSSRQGNFGLRLTVMTSEPLALEPLAALRQRLAAARPMKHFDNLWTAQPPPKSVADAFPSGGPHGAPERWTLNVLDTGGFNPTIEGVPAISKWDDDVSFAVGGAADTPPWWYYGDRDVAGVERFVREHGLAGWLGFMALLGFVWLLRRRYLRRLKPR